VTSDLNELATLLDRVASVGGLGLAYGRPEWLDQVIDAFTRIYALGFDEHGLPRQGAEIARLWLYIVARVYGLGGLAVRMGNWTAVRGLADRRPRALDFERHYASWLRHALTMAARAKILDEERNAGLIARAHNVVREVAALRPDVGADSEVVLNSLCQFDALSALVIMSGTDNKGGYYPSFSHYYSHRTEPALVTVIRDKAARRVIYPGDDDALAAAIRDINDAANREGFRYDGWDGLEDPVVRSFLESHPERNARA
jgi:hypothetical protein